MIKFLMKGLLRDRSRSLFPIMVVTAGVMLTVFLHDWLGGVLSDVIRSNANFMTGHVKIMTKAYAENEDQMPNDLAILGVHALLNDLRKEYPDITWVSRIRFGGLLDAPDKEGETRSQGPVMGLGVDLLSQNTPEIAVLNIKKAIVRGHLPDKPGQILISEDFAAKLGIKPGDKVTLLSSTMYGSMAIQNFILAGTVEFGVAPMDRSAMILDIKDARLALDMNDAAGEILGFFKNHLYNDAKAAEIKNSFQSRFSNSSDEFAPVMFTLREQNDLGEYLDMVGSFSGILVFIFVLAMSIVLWNAGLIGGLRRYGEIGVRLAIGESKGHVYASMILESTLIGLVGSIIGTAIGLGFSYYVQMKGFDASSLMKNSTMMLSNVMRTQITPESYYIGFFPGLFSVILGTALSGVGIYKRKTAQLFRELEA
ncbi:MAG: hypothetical protein DRP89_04650 [Candidatus Neomarinimicrobiota bacterium]|nr:MAG: hypothetical protein DRP89_04650 [Candidatus Neomarinimicrobiota bacterium]